jgi:hypothetical protein
MNKPYVGVSGITTLEEVQNVASIFHNNELSTDGAYVPTECFLSSSKVLDLGFNPTNVRYAYRNELKGLLEAAFNSGVQPAVHYNTKRPESLSDDVMTLFGKSGIYDKKICRMLQFNIPGVLDEEMDRIKSDFPGMDTILQVSDAFIGNMEIDDVAKRIKKLNPVRILIDNSRGSGKEIDVQYSANLYKNLKERGVTTSVGFAGGLSGKNVRNKVTGLKSELKDENFSWDAEGQLRKNEFMDMDEVASYISEGMKGIRSV